MAHAAAAARSGLPSVRHNRVSDPASPLPRFGRALRVTPPSQPPVHFSRLLCDRLCAEAAAQPEREICGLIGARAGRAVSHYPIRNGAADARRRYAMDPAAQIAAFKLMRARGETLAAIYHSHPDGAPIPSPRDAREWTYPEALCLIVGLAGGTPELRAWRWTGQGFASVALPDD
jgi:proteasome lid subunit RPN8/RPN11